MGFGFYPWVHALVHACGCPAGRPRHCLDDGRLAQGLGTRLLWTQPSDDPRHPSDSRLAWLAPMTIATDEVGGTVNQAAETRSSVRSIDRWVFVISARVSRLPD